MSLVSSLIFAQGVLDVMKYTDRDILGTARWQVVWVL